MRVKICGITRADDARAAAEAGAHALGLNFVPESARYIGGVPEARALVDEADAPEELWWAGVFVNPEAAAVLEAVRVLGLQVVQLHGEETPAFVRELKQKLPRQVALWKAQRVSGPQDLAALEEYTCDGWLVDAKVSGIRGGSGQTFDWSILRGLRRRGPFILSGGLTPDNVGAAIHEVAPDWVDVASGVESAPGIKDRPLMEKFMQAVSASQKG